jgi:hypothetical protein
MRMERPTVVEMKQLMFSAPLDVANARTAQRPRARRRQFSFERRMQHRHLRDRLAGRGVSQAAHGTLDFG